MNDSKHIKTFFIPDLAQKFLISNPHTIYNNLKEIRISFSYEFGSYNTYNPIAMKMILSLEALGIKCKQKNKKIKLSFGKSRIISKIYTYLDISLLDFLTLLVKMPLQRNVNSMLKTTEYFIFPGFPSKLFFPTWERKAILTFHFPPKQAYLSFFLKNAYFD